MTFKEDLRSDRIDGLTLREAIAIDPHTIVRAAIALMKSHSIGCAIVVDGDLHPIGVFSEQSVIRILNDGADIDSVPVSDFLDKTHWVVSKSDSVSELWKAVVDEGARFVAVTDSEGRLTALTGQRGLAEYVCDCYANQIAVQRLGSAPWMLQREGA